MVEDKLLRGPRGEDALAICFHLLRNLLRDFCGKGRGMAQDLNGSFRYPRKARGATLTHEGDVELHEHIKNGPYTLGVT